MQVPSIVFVVFLALGFLGGKVSAQDPKFTVLEAPTSEYSETYADQAERKRLQHDIRYIDELDGNLAEFKPSKETAVTNIDRDGRVNIGVNGYLFVIIALLAGIALLFYFGGTGQLLSKVPAKIKQKKTAPAHWKLGEVTSDDELFEQLENIGDDRTKMILLLRHCLMSAAEKTDVRFARSDTEREALRRVPASWSGFDALSELLVSTERVHYGGEVVTQEILNRSIEIAKSLLFKGRRIV